MDQIQYIQADSTFLLKMLTSFQPVSEFHLPPTTSPPLAVYIKKKLNISRSIEFFFCSYFVYEFARLLCVKPPIRSEYICSIPDE